MGGTNSKKETGKEPNQEFVLPSGLYQNCNWDPKNIKRLILGKRLAPFSAGQEEYKEGSDAEECPICFLFYEGGLNRSLCCKKGICTECFLQIKKPNGQSNCPFCLRVGYGVVFTGPLTKEEKEKEAWEEQQVLDAKLRMRDEEIEQDKIRAQKRRESMMLQEGEAATSVTAPPPSTTSSGGDVEVIASQSLPLRQVSPPDAPSLSVSYPPNTRNLGGKEWKRKEDDDSLLGGSEADLEDFMLQEAMRLSLLTPESGSDAETSDDGKSETEESILQSAAASGRSRDDLELALALALSLQNVIK